MKVITLIQAHFEQKISPEQFKEKLTEINKNDLINFIIHAQKTKCFIDFEDLSDYNEEYSKIYNK